MWTYFPLKVAARRLFFLIAIIGCGLASGCATYKQERFLDSKAANNAARAEPVEPSLATVYLVRKKLIMQSIMTMPVPPVLFALDGKMLAAVPLGSFVTLKLEPGKHELVGMFVVGDALTHSRITSELTLRLNLDAGRQYYAVYDQSILSGPSFQSVANVEGVVALKNAVLAKRFIAPRTLDDFKTKLAQPTMAASNQLVGSRLFESLGSLLPDQQTVNAFFEVTAAVATIGLMLFAISATGAGQASVPVYPSVAPSLAAEAMPISPLPVNARLEVTRSGGMTTVKSWSTGVTYRIEGQKIRGSDGTSYKIIGSSVFGEDGSYFQKLGNSIVMSDGRYCSIVGQTLDCRSSMK